MEAAAAGAESIAARMAQLPEQNSADLYSALANDMRSGNAAAVEGFGSNDCPTWTSVYDRS